MSSILSLSGTLKHSLCTAKAETQRLLKCKHLLKYSSLSGLGLLTMLNEMTGAMVFKSATTRTHVG